MKKIYFWVVGLAVLFLLQSPGFAGISIAKEKVDKNKNGETLLGILYVPMGPAKKVIALDLASNRILKTIPVKPETHGLAVTKDGKELYVLSMKDFETIFVYKSSTGKEVATINVGGPQHHVAVSPDGKFAYLSVMPSSVSVIDVTKRTQIASIKVGAAPNSVAFSPDSKYAYVTNSKDDTVSVIKTSTHQTVATIEVGELPSHIVVSPDGRRVFLTNTFSENISVIDTATRKVIDTIPAGRGTHGIAISPDGKFAVATNRGGSTYVVIDAVNNKRLRVVEIGQQPEHISILRVAGKTNIYVNVLSTHQILVIDLETDKVLKRLNVGVDPHAHAPYIPKK